MLQGDYLLRVNLEDFTGEKRYAEYGTFDITGADEKYTLTVDGYLGTAGSIPGGGGGGGNLIFSTYVGSGPASTVHPKKCQEF